MTKVWRKTFPWRDGKTLEVALWAYDDGHPDTLLNYTNEHFEPILKQVYKKSLYGGHVKDGLLGVYLEDKMIAGMLLSYVYAWYEDDPKVQTYHEAVLPEYQNQGVGTIMFQGLQEYVEHNGSVTLCKIRSLVDKDSADTHAQIGFMEKCGFFKSQEPEDLEHNEPYIVFSWENPSYDGEAKYRNLDFEAFDNGAYDDPLVLHI